MNTFPPLAPLADILKAVTVPAIGSAGEPPESWAEPIEQMFVATGNAARQDAARDVQHIAAQWQFNQRIQAQRNELRLLVRQHYVSRLAPAEQAVFWSVPRSVGFRWRELGILGPTTPAKPLRETLDLMAEAARLTDILHRDVSYSDMRVLASRAPLENIDKIALAIANETLVSAIEKMAMRHGDGLSDIAANEQRKALLSLLGRLPNTGYGKNVRVRLAQQMAELLHSRDYGREWERAAVTTTRYAYNLGILTRLLYQQTVRWVAFDVHPDACVHCQTLLLWPDGEPRVFSLDQLWNNIAEDGGMNIGRKASLIGQPGGWRVTVIQHPFCRCRPRRAKRQEINRYLASLNSQAGKGEIGGS